MDYSDQKPVDPLTLDVYAGPRPAELMLSAEFKLYEDDGLSLDYRKGAHAWTTIAFHPFGAGDYMLAIHPAEGRFAGQLDKRHYLIRIHGLLKPQAVAFAAMPLPKVGVVVVPTPLPEVGDDPCKAGWTWDPQTRITTIRLPNAYATDRRVNVELQQAGTFADALVLQKARNLRNQIREAKRLMKLRNAELVGTDLELKKPARVILKAEVVERELNAIVEHPQGSAANPPDFPAMRGRVLAALTDKPFDCTRKIPDSDPNSVAAAKQIENATFTPAEIKAITDLLRGADLPAWPYP
jgi:hypothetical protein